MATSNADKELMELQRSIATQGHAAGLPHGADAADPGAVTTWHARRAAQREAYGQFVALGPIYIGNALAFNGGSPVPLEHVIKFELEAQELVARVATPELARVGKVFSEEEFHRTNPHVKARASIAPELHPAALDPRGGAAHLDTEGRHGAVVSTSGAVSESEDHQAAAGQAAADIVAAGEKADKASARRAPKENS